MYEIGQPSFSLSIHHAELVTARVFVGNEVVWTVLDGAEGREIVTLFFRGDHALERAHAIADAFNEFAVAQPARENV